MRFKLKEIVEDLSSVLTFVPKKYCNNLQKDKQLLWDSWESEYLENLRDS